MNIIALCRVLDSRLRKVFLAARFYSAFAKIYYRFFYSVNTMSEGGNLVVSNTARE